MAKDKTVQKIKTKKAMEKKSEVQVLNKSGNTDNGISGEKKVTLPSADGKAVHTNDAGKANEKKSSAPLKNLKAKKSPANSLRILDQFNSKLNLANRLNARPYLALDIDNDKISYIKTKKSGQNIQIEQCGVQPLDPAIDRFKAMQITLTKLQSRVYQHGMKVFVSFYSPDINIRHIVVPKTKKKSDLKSAIFFKNQTDLPNFDDESIWNYQILEEFLEDDIKKLRILVTTIPGEVVKQYVEVLISTGLRPEKLVPRPIAIATAYNAMVPQTDNDLVVVISTFFTQICYFRNGKLQFFRNAAMGVSNIQKAMEEKNDDSLSMNDEQKKLTKENNSGQNGDTTSSLKERLLKKVKESKGDENPVIKMLHLEIKRSIDYINSAYPNDKVKRIFVSGSGIQLGEVIDYLQGQYNGALYLLKPQFSSTEVNTLRYGEYFTALGTSLQAGREFNTIPAQYKSRQLFKNLNILLTTFLFLSIGGAISVSSYQKYEYIKSQNTLAQLGQQYQILYPVQTKYNEMVINYGGVHQDINKLTGFVKKRPEVLEVMRLFSNETPAFIVLNEMNFEEYVPQRGSRKNRDNAQPSYKYRITLSGQINSDFQMGDVVLINFMNRLNDLNYFKEIKLTNKRKEMDRNLFEFWLQMLL